MLFLRRLSQLSFWCLIGHITAGILLSLIIVWLKAEERSSFSCVDSSEKAEDSCYSKYETTYDSPLPYLFFILLNFGLVHLATSIYSLCARDSANGGKVNSVYLALQLLSGTVFTFLQHGVFYPKGFGSQFNCTFPSTEPQYKLNYKHVICESTTAVNKDLVMLFVSMANVVVALISLVELIHLLRRGNFQFLACVEWIWSRDSDDNIYCFGIKIKGKNIKWMKRSLKHRDRLEQLVKTLKYKPSTVKKIGVYYVCFEDRFLIDRGNMANGTKVFVGLSTDGLEVAVKRLDLNFSYLADHERKIMNLPKLLENPRVLNYRFYAEKKNYAYLVVELQEENLKQYVRSTERSLAALQNEGPTILKQILQGFEPLHDENILHRDLKPQNILVNVEGKMVLADFGICRRLEPGQTTHESIIRGTEGWMAVESLPTDADKNLLSDDEITVRYKKQSDVQVLGMLFYFVLTKGEHPFGLFYFDRLTNIRRDVFDLTKLTDPVAKDLILWMLQNDFTKRPTVKECLKHPYLVSPERNFELLKAVGNELEIKTKDQNSTVVQELNQEASLTTPLWRGKIDGEVYKYFSGSRKYSDDVADLLRFIRNAAVHWNDKPQPPSVQQKVRIPRLYFLNLFPTLPMIVHRVIRSHPYWCHKDDLKQFF